MNKSNYKNKVTIRDKTNYVNNLIKEQNGLTSKDSKAYLYIYDITKYLVHKKVNMAKLTSEIPEEMTQNIIIQVFKRFNQTSLRKKNKDANLMSIFPYLSRCVLSETSKLKTSTYGGNLPRIDESLKGTLFHKEDIIYQPTFETEAVIKVERKVKAIISEVKNLVEQNILSIPVENRSFVVFPLLVAISRRNLTLFEKYPDRLKVLIRQIYNNAKNPLERIKF